MHAHLHKIGRSLHGLKIARFRRCSTAISHQDAASIALKGNQVCYASPAESRINTWSARSVARAICSLSSQCRGSRKSPSIRAADSALTSTSIWSTAFPSRARSRYAAWRAAPLIPWAHPPLESALTSPDGGPAVLAPVLLPLAQPRRVRAALAAAAASCSAAEIAQSAQAAPRAGSPTAEQHRIRAGMGSLRAGFR